MNNNKQPRLSQAVYAGEGLPDKELEAVIDYPVPNLAAGLELEKMLNSKTDWTPESQKRAAELALIVDSYLEQMPKGMQGKKWVGADQSWIPLAPTWTEGMKVKLEEFLREAESIHWRAKFYFAICTDPEFSFFVRNMLHGIDVALAEKKRDEYSADATDAWKPVVRICKHHYPDGFTYKQLVSNYKLMYPMRGMETDRHIRQNLTKQLGFELLPDKTGRPRKKK